MADENKTDPQVIISRLVDVIHNMSVIMNADVTAARRAKDAEAALEVARAETQQALSQAADKEAAYKRERSAYDDLLSATKSLESRLAESEQRNSNLRKDLEDERKEHIKTTQVLSAARTEMDRRYVLQQDYDQVVTELRQLLRTYFGLADDPKQPRSALEYVNLIANHLAACLGGAA